MPVIRPAQKPPKAPGHGVAVGLYFTDGRRLLRVSEVVEKSVMLEDCARPEGLPVFMDLPELRQQVREGRMRRVVPA